jgi:hypothetical protein
VRIYFLGSQCVGTTSLTKYVSNAYLLPSIPDPVRVVCREEGLDLETIRDDVHLAGKYQLRVFERKLELESQHIGDYVADQGIDCVAYTLAYTLVGKLLLDSKPFIEFLNKIKAVDSIVFFVKAHKSLVRSDGFRPRQDVNWGSVKFIEGIIFTMLEMYDIKYHVIGCKEWFWRIKQIESILGPPKVKVELEDDWCLSTKGVMWGCSDEDNMS